MVVVRVSSHDDEEVADVNVTMVGPGSGELSPEEPIAVMSRYATVPANTFAEPATDRVAPDRVPTTGDTP
jgi:hypothetical protein